MRRPALTLLVLFLITVFLGSYIPQGKLDASSDSLTLEGDTSLEYYRQTVETYGSAEFLLVTYEPTADLLSDKSLQHLRELRDELAALEVVDSVVSILDVPLLASPKISLTDISGEMNTLSTPGIDRELVRRELAESPIYKSLLTNTEVTTTVLQVNLRDDVRYHELRKARDVLRDKRRAEGLTAAEEAELATAAQVFKDYIAQTNEERSAYIVEIRNILERYRSDEVTIFLGGVPMIADDMMSFVKNDLKVFGLGIFAFIVILLATFFRSLRWVVAPLLGCAMTAIVMMGFLAFVDWRLTVISSNFFALLLVVTLSVCVHLVVRYRELLRENPDADNRKLVGDTVRFMAMPCLYTTLTTLVAFASLVVSGIRPVIDFGWMMSIGIVLALVWVFVFMPAAMLVLGRGGAEKTGSNASPDTPPITVYLARFSDHHRLFVILVCAGLAVMSVIGITQLKVENRFIDYFHESTEIYQGMETVDRELGGTIPLDIIIEAAPDAIVADEEFDEFADDEDEFGDDFDSDSVDEFADDFADEFDSGGPEYVPSAWFNRAGMERVEEIHDYLETLPETGKVLSLATLYKVSRDLMGEVDDIQLAVLQQGLPDIIQDILVVPYLSDELNQTRISLRVKETSRELNRNQFLIDLRKHLVEEMGIDDERLHFTGMLVLYNNMLQSLFTSQILTLSFVFVAIMAMFLVLFRSLTIAVLGMVPTLLAAGMVLGIMGWLSIPLDMMTITIAAITVGIGVDNVVHYVYRFRVEFAKDRQYLASMYRSHGSIGRAMFYTSATIIIGFSILALSNFNPSIIFGLLTGLAMLAALVGALTLLPILLVLVKPLGPEN